MAVQSRARTVIRSDHPFLAFVNTVADDGKSREQNLFQSGEHLVQILEDAGVRTPKVPPTPAELSDLIFFREAAYGVLAACASKQTPLRDDTVMLELVVKSALSRGRYEFGEGGLRIEPWPDGGLKDVLALAFLELATSSDFARLSECQRCTYLFLNHGRGRGRRWCDMARCGNRAKAESFRARKRAVQS